MPTALPLLLFATVCLGGTPEEDRSVDTGKPIASERLGLSPNQSASIDESLTPMTSPVPLKTDTNRKNDAREVAAQGATRVARRIPRDVGASPRPAAPTLPDVPWYRTGIGALSIVLAIIAAAVWCVRRWMPKFGGTACSALNVVGTTALSPKHTVALVSLGQRFVLVGLSGERMTRICEVTDPQEVAELTLRLGQSTAPAKAARNGGARAFESLLDGEVNEYAKPATSVSMDVSREKNDTGKGAREPLSALLTRLRSFQVK